MAATRLTLLAFVFWLNPACTVIRDVGREPVPAGNAIVIGHFTCNCEPLVAESIRDAFVSQAFERTNATVTKGEKASAGQVFIQGVVTIDTGSSTSSKSAIVGVATAAIGTLGGGGSAKSAAGTLVTGITAQAYKNGVLLAARQLGQDLAGGTIQSPLTMAGKIAAWLAADLIKKRAVGRK